MMMVLVGRAAALEIGQLARQHDADRGLRGAFIGIDRLHLSLLTLGQEARLPSGSFRPELVEKACLVGDTVSTGAFQVTFDQAMSFRNSRAKKPYVLTSTQGNEGVDRLFGELWQGCLGPDAAPPKTTPHVTMLYGAMREPISVPPISWTIRDFSLVHSLVGQSTYRVLQRWKLEEGGAVRVPSQRDRT